MFDLIGTPTERAARAICKAANGYQACKCTEKGGACETMISQVKQIANHLGLSTEKLSKVDQGGTVYVRAPKSRP
ncbi:hypothetical protein J7443_17520 [Tropicibacter sp. R15_0]|uniref:hypothetical protein n=1 Tax=Tropicibacter sp. R15_0 TaxID=2821101 RepID=UPI001ADC7F39|nr:hypothetical protein [Tropicibacter sp. R15_0]MBO9467047.1 hypothetical protein [Tropicibacter sp. R15_0]